MKRDRAWIDVLDELHGVTVVVPAPFPTHTQKLMDTLGVNVIVAKKKVAG